MRSATLTRVLLVRPGATDFDEQGRMKGSLDMPLSPLGVEQAQSVAIDLCEFPVKTIFTAPCESARETADHLAEQARSAGRDTKIKVIEAFRNIDHGLWHGKLIDEVRRNHPKVYRQGAEHPEEFCPPGGESLVDAKARVLKALRKCVKKSRDEMAVLVIPDPLATVVESLLSGADLTNVWNSETDSASWSVVETDLA